MKNVFMTAMLLSLTIISCSDKKDTAPVPVAESNTMLEEPKPVNSAAVAAKAAPASPEAEGKALVEGADCLSCHKVDSKYTDADIDHLAQKVIDGGKGVWGEIPMTPHAGLSKDNAQKMVKYILSMKK